MKTKPGILFVTKQLNQHSSSKQLAQHVSPYGNTESFHDSMVFATRQDPTIPPRATALPRTHGLLKEQTPISTRLRLRYSGIVSGSTNQEPVHTH